MASIRERKGKFNVIYNYKDDSGKRKQKWETYDTKAEAKKRKREIEYKQEIPRKSEGNPVRIPLPSVCNFHYHN